MSSTTLDANADLVLLLGAGFSRYAGLPTMAQFGGTFHDRQQRVKNAETSQILGADSLKTAGLAFQSFRDYCRKAIPFINVDYDNLEELFCAVEAMREAGVTKLDGVTPSSTDEIYDSLALWTWNIYQGLPDYFGHSTSSDVAKTYGSFVEWLKSLGCRKTVLTTNYDALFETIAYKAGIGVRYPFEATPLWVVDAHKQSYLSAKKAICLCKLHGSVTYFDRKNGKKNELCVCSQIARHKDGAIGGSQSVQAYRPHPAVICLGTLGALRKNHQIVPAIIPPTYAKLTGTEWVRKTWSTAVDSLRKAKVMVIIGYSFPSSDGFMRAMILSAMATREPKLPLHVMLVSPDRSSYERVGELFRPLAEEGRLVWRARKFEDWSPGTDSKLSSWLG